MTHMQRARVLLAIRQPHTAHAHGTFVPRVARTLQTAVASSCLQHDNLCNINYESPIYKHQFTFSNAQNKLNKPRSGRAKRAPLLIIIILYNVPFTAAIQSSHSHNTLLSIKVVLFQYGLSQPCNYAQTQLDCSGDKASMLCSLHFHTEKTQPKLKLQLPF